jgi:maltose alpha-D-glucosyltransferase/alpha-amylase
LQAPDTDGLPDIVALVADKAATLETEILPGYLQRRRWFASKDRPISSCRITKICRLPGEDPQMALYKVETAHGSTTDSWLLPLAVVWESQVQPLSKALALARIRCGGADALLTDAFSHAEFACRLVQEMRSHSTIAASGGEVLCIWIPADSQSRAGAEPHSVDWLSAEQSNSSLVVDGSVMLKIFRRVASGPHPEAEMSRYLTAGGFANTPALLGEVVGRDRAGQTQTLAVAQAFVGNQGDAWNWALPQVARYLHEFFHDDSPGSTQAQAFTRFGRAVGRRLGEMHRVLACETDDPAFAARPATPDDVAGWIRGVEDELKRAYSVLAHAEQHAHWDGQTAASLKELLERRELLLAALPDLGIDGPGSIVSRIHGDFHLGQVLVAGEDAYIIDFEGEPSKSLAARRAKASPLNDVAGMLRSFRYALAMAIKAEPDVDRFPEHVRRNVLEPIVSRAESGFLDAYREAVRGLAGLESAGLLDLFLVRKAAYEIGYEAANRPDWLPVPMQGLREIARRLGKDTDRVAPA